MSIHTTVSKRVALCLTALLLIFVVPLVTQAVFPANGTWLKSVSVKIWAAQGDTDLGKAPVVAAGDNFTINWKATGKDINDNPTSDGITCVNNWGTDKNSEGATTDSILTSRTFFITCAGVGAGRIAGGTITVGRPDLIISSFIITGLVPKENTSGVFLSWPSTVKISLKNLGTTAVLNKNFKVKIVYGLGTNTGVTADTAILGKTFFVNDGIGIGGRNIVAKVLDYIDMFIQPSTGTGPDVNNLPLNSWYFTACVDADSEVQESNELNPHPWLEPWAAFCEYRKSEKRIKGSKLRSSYPCAGAQGVRRAEFPLRTLGSQRSLADSLTALLHGETTVSPTPFADPPFIPA